MNVKIAEFDQALQNILNSYSKETTDALKDEIKNAAEYCVEQVEARAPGRGTYASSWRNRKSYEDPLDVRYTVYSKKYQLVHLLEYGHDKWLWGKETGGMVAPKPHVRPAVDATETQLINRLKVRL